MLRGTSVELNARYLLEVHAAANEILINCTSAKAIDILYNKLILSFAQPIDVTLIILSCLQNSLSHMRALSGGPEGDKSKTFCQKIGQRSQIP